MRILNKVLFVILTLFFISTSLIAQEKRNVFEGTAFNKTVAENRSDNIPSQINAVTYRSLNLAEPIKLDGRKKEKNTLHETLIEDTRKKIFSGSNMALIFPNDARKAGKNDIEVSKVSEVREERMISEFSPDVNDEKPQIGSEENKLQIPLNREVFSSEFGRIRAENRKDFLFSESINNNPDDTNRAYTNGKFHWKNAIVQSLTFLTIQHMARLPQPRTNSRLGGRFFADWFKSVRNLKGWADGDGFITNYLEHGMQGSVTGRIFINNSEKSRLLEFGKSRAYWRSRAKAMAWSAVWSAQFELGPISEASIGNVGIYATRTFSHMSYQDLVLTPTIGTAMLIGSDVVDKYVLKNWLERKAETRMGVRLLRMFVTPVHAFVNAISGRAPWKRYGRF